MNSTLQQADDDRAATIDRWLAREREALINVRGLAVPIHVYRSVGDEATAVLAGDALQTLAFELLASPQGGIDPRLAARLVLRLAQAAGAHGMVGGQAFDI
ncbi:MAG: hypothetical protein ACLGHY_09580, partial [Gammaproteobacteria bacterium]